MRINQSKRIYMTEADGSPGNGAPVAPLVPAAPIAEPKAPEPQTPPSPQYVTKADLEAFGNGLFANFRKAGLLKQEKPASEPTTPAQPTASAPAAVQAGLSMADVEALLERKDVVSSRAAKHGLNDSQKKRFEAAMSSVSRESLAAEADSYLTDMGLVRSTESTTQPASAPAQPAPSGPPLSDKGSPAPGGVVNWEREFAENPGFMSAAARGAMDAKYGHEKARRMRIEAVNAPGGQAERLRVVTKG